MNSFISKVLDVNSDVLIFKNDNARVEFIAKLEQKYSSVDDTIITTKNRQTIDYKTAEQDALQLARPFLKAMSTSRYLPKFVDKRNSEQRIRQAQDIGKVVDHFLDKLGYAFQLEHLGDTTVRQEIRGFIERNYLYEAGSADGQLVFRKHFQGMFGPPISPVDLIKKISTQYLDHERTSANESQLERDLEDKILKKFGVSERAELNDKQRQIFTQEMTDAKAKELVSYTTKKLPVKQPDEYREEFKLRALHKAGLIDERFADGHTRMNIDGSVKASMESLNGLPEFTIPGFTGKINHEPWEGLGDVDNNQGYYLTADHL
jgi:hypothetical protein